MRFKFNRFVLFVNICLIVFASGITAVFPASERVISQYMQQRTEAIQNDAKINFSRGIVLNEKEKAVNVYLMRLVQSMQDEYKTSSCFPPTRYFTNVKKMIEASSLFQFLRKMPKGGVLHIHTHSAGNARWLIDRAIEEENSYIYLQEDGSELKGRMQFFKKDEAPKGYELMRELSFKDKDFAENVVQMITMNAQDSASENPWDKFENCFRRISGLLRDEPLFKSYCKNAFEAIVNDHVMIIELRTGVYSLTDREGKKYDNDGFVGILRSIQEELRRINPNFWLKLIISDSRTESVDEVRCDLAEAYRLRAKHPDMIKGFDLVGFETTGNTTLFYLNDWLLAAPFYRQKYGIQLPYFFHDGESDWANNTNLYDAVLLNCRRIGHGFNLFYFPWLTQQVKAKGICMEVCPISNQVLGFVKDLRIHPGAGYLRQGLPCVLSSDDPMLFESTGLSYDFWEAIMAWNLDLSDIKQLCLNSILYSSLEENEKREALKHWQQEWDFFIQDAYDKTALLFKPNLPPKSRLNFCELGKMPDE